MGHVCLTWKGRIDGWNYRVCYYLRIVGKASCHLPEQGDIFFFFTLLVWLCSVIN